MAAIEENLLQNVHENLKLPVTDGDTVLMRGHYRYYHYGCDGTMDQGWGCGYRTLQTICSWIKSTLKLDSSVPNIPAIQNILVQLEDKPLNFVNSRDWIGSFEGSELDEHVPSLVEHFQKFGSPLMMGGDQDCSAKAIMGIHCSQRQVFLLIVDPHFSGKSKSVEDLQKKNWVKWQPLDDFMENMSYTDTLTFIYTKYMTFILKKIKSKYSTKSNTENLKRVYYAYFHGIMSLGIIFWGNSTDYKKIHFQKIEILPFVNEYLRQLLYFVSDNCINFTTNFVTHNIHNRSKSDVHKPEPNQTNFLKRVYYLGIKYFNITKINKIICRSTERILKIGIKNPKYTPLSIVLRSLLDQHNYFFTIG
ncbi:hypothetical protein C0J52_07393 [Blattella germanica]|nr:hypothetical protein C0J52_07393 [Blattella germanica]